MTAEEELNQKYDIHQAVQKAIESAHSNPSPQTIKMFDELKTDIKEMKGDIKDILIQATKTNGRVSKTEEWSERAQKIIEHNTEGIEAMKDNLALMNERHSSDKKQVILAVTIATFFLATVGSLGYKVVYESIKDDNKEIISQQVNTAVETTLKSLIKEVKE